MVVAITAVISAIAVGLTPSVIRTTKGNAGAAQVASALQRARELAISRRRNVQVAFTAPNELVLSQVDVPGPGTTQLERVLLEGGIEFVRFAEIGEDTRDGFGRTQAIALGGPTPVMFTSEGSFVDANGDPINATIQLGIPRQVETATAVTVLGTTAYLRQYRWNGADWIE